MVNSASKLGGKEAGTIGAMGQSNAPQVEPIPLKRLIAIALLAFLAGFVVLEIIDPRWVRPPSSEAPTPGLPSLPVSPRPSPSASPRAPAIAPAARPREWPPLPEESGVPGPGVGPESILGPP